MVLISRATGPGGKGEYALAVGAGSLGALFLALRWERPVGYFCAREPSKLGAIVGSILLVTIVSTGLGHLLWHIHPALFSNGVLKNMSAETISLALWIIAPTFLWMTIASMYGGLREFKTRTVFLLVASAVQSIQIAVQFLLGSDTAASYLAWYFYASMGLYVAWLVGMLIHRRLVPTLNAEMLVSMARYGIFSYVSVILDMVIVRLDMYLLNYLTGDAAQSGLYSVSVGIANQMGRIATILATVIFNRTSAHEMGAGERTALAVRLAAIAMAGTGIVLMVGGAVLIVPLCGPRFAPSVPPLFLMVPATIFFGLFRLLGADIEGRGRPALMSCCSLLAAVAIVVLDFWLIPLHGIMGAAWASLLAYCLAAAAAGFVFCRVTGLSAARAFVLRRDDVVVLAGVLRTILKGGLRRRAQDV